MSFLLLLVLLSTLGCDGPDIESTIEVMTTGEEVQALACAGDIDCIADPNGPLCAPNSFCGECNADVDCPGATPICLGDPGSPFPPYTCVECEVDGDCSAGDECTANNCVTCNDTGAATCPTCPGATPYWDGSACTECVTDGNCGGGDICDGGTCVECAVDGDCAEGDKCVASSCTECSDWENCPTCTDPDDTFWCEGCSTCMFCFGDDGVTGPQGGTCGVGEECACQPEMGFCQGAFWNGGNGCSSCVTDGSRECDSCPGATPYWTGSSCGECAVDANCGGGQVCDSGTCVECVVDGDCGGAAPICNNNQCSTCGSDLDCDDGNTCNGTQTCSNAHVGAGAYNCGGGTDEPIGTICDDGILTLDGQCDGSGTCEDCVDQAGCEDLTDADCQACTCAGNFCNCPIGPAGYEPPGSPCSVNGGAMCDGLGQGNGNCVECIGNGDCAGTEVCNAGVCEAACDNDSDCPNIGCDAGVCNNPGTAAASCSTTDDGNGNGSACDQDLCCDDGNPCTSEHCDAGGCLATGNAPLGTTCDDGGSQADGQCNAGSCEDCTDDSGCTGINQCNTNTDSCCAGATPYFNIVEGCVECLGNGDCGGGDVCSGGSCIPPLPVCGNGVIDGGETCDDSNTVAGDGCDDICIIETCYELDGGGPGVIAQAANTPCGGDDVCNGSGSCVTPTCVVDGDCDDLNECSQDTCNNPGSVSASCSHIDEALGTSCDDAGAQNDGQCSGGICEDCTDDTGCSGGNECNFIMNTCCGGGAPYFNGATCVECIFNGDCGGGDVCVAGICQECAVDGDCSIGEECNAPNCDSCITDGSATCSTCGGGTPYWNGATCEECVSDANCAGDDVCDAGTCVTPACMNNGDCDDANDCTDNVCNNAGTASAFCVNDNEALGEVCDDGVLPDSGQCDGSGSCIDCIDGSGCSVAQPLCIANACEECAIDGDCAIGEECNANNCNGCNTTGASTCPTCGGGTPYWNGATCEECVVDANCGGGDICLAGVCEPPSVLCGNGVFDAGEVCDDGNTVNGDGCSSGCIEETCYTCVGFGPGSCSADAANSSCGGDNICDGVGSCVAPTCVDDGDCADPGACLDAVCNNPGTITSFCGAVDNDADTFGCADPGECAVRACGGGSCSPTPRINGLVCDDGVATLDGQCVAGVCEDCFNDSGCEDLTDADCQRCTCSGVGCVCPGDASGFEPQGSPCSLNGGSMCDGLGRGAGNCVQCIDDGDCGGGLVCSAGSCVASTCSADAECDRGNPCEVPTCNDPGLPSANCSYAPVAPNTDCGGGDVCDGSSNCVTPNCFVDTDCADPGACLDALCVNGGLFNASCGSSINNADSASCADPGECRSRSCSGGSCSPSNDLAGGVCDDGAQDGTGQCDGGGSCIDCLDDSGCTGANICNGANQCVAPPPNCGNGVNNAPEQCDDGNTINGDGCDSNCLIESCHACVGFGPGSCAPEAVNTPCGGVNICDGAGTCVVPTCTLGSCDDGNDCTDDFCNNPGTVASSCSATNRADGVICDDGVVADGDGQCSSGICVDCLDNSGCVSGTNVCDVNTCVASSCIDDTDCDDGNACTTNTCSDGGLPTSSCNTSNVAENTDCDGGAGDDVCDGLGTCTTPFCLDDGICDDGNLCTDDSCIRSGEWDAACDSTTVVDRDCGGGQVCNVAANCVTPACDNDADCETDGTLCTTDTCTDAGLSTAICSRVNVDCTPQLCDPVDGLCYDCLTDADCADTDNCTNDICAAGGCSNSAVVCPPGDICNPADVNGTCVQCIDDSTCDPGTECDGGLNVCVECIDPIVICPTCPANRPYWDGSSCRECIDDAQCSGAEQCIRNRCDDEDCDYSDPDLDCDADGLTNLIEDRNDNGVVEEGETDPLDPDTDNDGLLDGIEDSNMNGRVDDGETDPLNPDSDGDSLLDGVEDANQDGVLDTSETDPLNVDSDGDGLCDGPVLSGANACSSSEDRNGNGHREASETDPVLSDTDADGILDGVEDSNLNGAVDAGETNPLDPDSDGDGLLDGEEDANQNGSVDVGETNPLDADTDDDVLSDGTEVLGNPEDDGRTSNPLDPCDPNMKADACDDESELGDACTTDRDCTGDYICLEGECVLDVIVVGGGRTGFQIGDCENSQLPFAMMSGLALVGVIGRRRRRKR